MLLLSHIRQNIVVNVQPAHEDAGSVQERRMLIEKCQQISAAQCIRISFLSGDVHVCAAGRLYSDPKVKTLFSMPKCCF